MALSEHRVGATIAVTDMSRARDFYESKLGLSAGDMDDPGGVVYECGEGTSLLVYSSPERAGKSEATLATWEVPDLDQIVEELTSKGVVFEQYEEPMKTDERGIHTMEAGSIAWFKDPDGNTIAVGRFN
ncbi:MAG TPA: VOC family protein [Solirubrobacterales bacterium]|jgi:catechol 2,3-dioxygenase-like lactoylglutathione lyase family enzyme